MMEVILLGGQKIIKKVPLLICNLVMGIKSYKNENVRNLMRRSISWVIKETADLKK
jgi:hypothetical protein